MKRSAIVEPTAMHQLRTGHETEVSSTGPRRRASWVQSDPFHVATSGPMAPLVWRRNGRPRRTTLTLGTRWLPGRLSGSLVRTDSGRPRRERQGPRPRRLCRRPVRRSPGRCRRRCRACSRGPVQTRCRRRGSSRRSCSSRPAARRRSRPWASSESRVTKSVRSSARQSPGTRSADCWPPASRPHARIRPPRCRRAGRCRRWTPGARRLWPASASAASGGRPTARSAAPRERCRRRTGPPGRRRSTAWLRGKPPSTDGR